MRHAGCRWWWVMLAAVLFSPGAGAEEAKTDPRVYGIGEKVEGKTYAEWEVAWWQWALGIKKDRNPILDATGDLAAEGQAGPVWFLAGNTGGRSARKCVVPAGKPIFFPLVTMLESGPAATADDKELLELTKEATNREVELEVVIDGKPVTGLQRFRAKTVVFPFTGPEREADALFGDAGKQKAASDGYWLLLKPLPAGKHTLRFRGKLKEMNGISAFEVELSYELMVEKKK